MAEVMTLYVGPELKDCVGVGPMKCMMVRRAPDEAYTYFYDDIEGFEFEPGYEVELLVEVGEVPNPPADASSLRYKLVEVVSKTAVATAAPPLAGTRWVMTSQMAENGDTVTALPRAEVYAIFEEGRVGGSSGCNRYGAGYTVDGNRLSVSPEMMSTMMACPEPVMRQEQLFQANLQAAATFAIAGPTLTIANGAGQIVLTLMADEPVALAGTNWLARNYNNGRQAVVSLLAGTTITARFDEEGRVSGSAGCNNYFANYTVEGDAMSIGPAGSTRKMCARPEGIMEQESLYLQALARVATYRIEGKVLELRAAEGALIASYEAEPDSAA